VQLTEFGFHALESRSFRADFTASQTPVLVVVTRVRPALLTIDVLHHCPHLLAARGTDQARPASREHMIAPNIGSSASRRNQKWNHALAAGHHSSSIGADHHQCRVCRSSQNLPSRAESLSTTSDPGMHVLVRTEAAEAMHSHSAGVP
jgi:hypothetical protein